MDKKDLLCTAKCYPRECPNLAPNKRVKLLPYPKPPKSRVTVVNLNLIRSSLMCGEEVGGWVITIVIGERKRRGRTQHLSEPNNIERDFPPASYFLFLARISDCKLTHDEQINRGFDDLEEIRTDA